MLRISITSFRVRFQHRLRRLLPTPGQTPAAVTSTMPGILTPCSGANASMHHRPSPEICGQRPRDIPRWITCSYASVAHCDTSPSAAISAHGPKRTGLAPHDCSSPGSALSSISRYDTLLTCEQRQAFLTEVTRMASWSRFVPNNPVLSSSAKPPSINHPPAMEGVEFTPLRN